MAAGCRRATGRGTLIGAILGLASLVSVIVAEAFHVLTIAWTWYVAMGASVTFVAGWTASVMLDSEK